MPITRSPGGGPSHCPDSARLARCPPSAPPALAHCSWNPGLSCPPLHATPCVCHPRIQDGSSSRQGPRKALVAPGLSSGTPSCSLPASGPARTSPSYPRAEEDGVRQAFMAKGPQSREGGGSCWLVPTPTPPGPGALPDPSSTSIHRPLPPLLRMRLSLCGMQGTPGIDVRMLMW